MSLPDNQYQTLITNHQLPPLLNIGCGEDLTIRELVDMVKQIIGFSGDVNWDRGKPDGTPQKLLDVTRLSAFGWKPRTGLNEGIGQAYEDYLSRASKDVTS